MPRAYALFAVLEKIDDNACKVDLLRDYGVFATFNIEDLSLYLEDDYLANLMSNFSKQGKDDGGPSNQSNGDFKILQAIAFHKFKLKILLTFCKCIQLEVTGLTLHIYPVLCMLFPRPFGGHRP